MHGPAYLDLRLDFYRVCEFVAINSLLANFLPSHGWVDRVCISHAPEKMRHSLNFTYCLLVDIIAGFGLNWRTHLPSLDQEFIGFKRTVRHKYRNWRQAKTDEIHIGR